MPLPNDPQAGDRYNTQGYLTLVPLPLSSNFAVGRIDHDFGSNWRFMTSYRYYKFTQFTNNQVDIGGALPGDTFGQASAKSQKPQTPSYWVAGLTGVITPHLINDFHYSYLRNAWQWSQRRSSAAIARPGRRDRDRTRIAQVALVPYPVDRGRCALALLGWSGQRGPRRSELDPRQPPVSVWRQYQRNFDKHQRNDNGVNIISSVVYQVNSGSGIAMPSAYIPSTVPANQAATGTRCTPRCWAWSLSRRSSMRAAAASCCRYRVRSFRRASFLPTTCISAIRGRSTRDFTLTYGLGYDVQMPPYELNGNQPMMVDQQRCNRSLPKTIWLSERAAWRDRSTIRLSAFRRCAMSAQRTEVSLQPFYGGFSPRLAAAWNPKFDDGLLGKICSPRARPLFGAVTAESRRV